MMTEVSLEGIHVTGQADSSVRPRTNVTSTASPVVLWNPSSASAESDVSHNEASVPKRLSPIDDTVHGQGIPNTTVESALSSIQILNAPESNIQIQESHSTSNHSGSHIAKDSSSNGTKLDTKVSSVKDNKQSDNGSNADSRASSKEESNLDAKGRLPYNRSQEKKEEGKSSHQLRESGSLNSNGACQMLHVHHLTE